MPVPRWEEVLRLAEKGPYARSRGTQASFQPLSEFQPIQVAGQGALGVPPYILDSQPGAARPFDVGRNPVTAIPPVGASEYRQFLPSSGSASEGAAIARQRALDARERPALVEQAVAEMMGARFDPLTPIETPQRLDPAVVPDIAEAPALGDVPFSQDVTLGDLQSVYQPYELPEYETFGDPRSVAVLEAERAARNTPVSRETPAVLPETMQPAVLPSYQDTPEVAPEIQAISPQEQAVLDMRAQISDPLLREAYQVPETVTYGQNRLEQYPRTEAYREMADAVALQRASQPVVSLSDADLDPNYVPLLERQTGRLSDAGIVPTRIALDERGNPIGMEATSREELRASIEREVAPQVARQQGILEAKMLQLQADEAASEAEKQERTVDALDDMIDNYMEGFTGKFDAQGKVLESATAIGNQAKAFNRRLATGELRGALAPRDIDSYVRAYAPILKGRSPRDVIHALLAQYEYLEAANLVPPSNDDIGNAIIDAVTRELPDVPLLNAAREGVSVIGGEEAP